MRRGSIHVRLASLDDTDVLLGFAGLVRGLPRGRRQAGRQSAVDEVRSRYQSLLINPGRRVVLAVDDADTVLGMAVFSREMAGELLDVPVIRVTHLVVDRGQRRRGAGRALVAAAGHYAHEEGVDYVSIGATTIDREANRFLARLGFAPVAVHRIAALPALSRHLALPESDDAAGDVARRNTRRVRRAMARSPLDPERNQERDLA